jgi:hypothetical protein
MSYESVIADLKALNKHRFTSRAATDHVDHMVTESDRSAIILMGSSLEDTVAWSLRNHMPGLNSDEDARIFGFEGPCGSFSNKLRMAHALGLIDRPMRKGLEIIKEMRNSAAHSIMPINYGLPEIRAAIAQLFPPRFRDEITGWDQPRIKHSFLAVSSFMGRAITRGEGVNFDALVPQLRAWRPPSPDKSPAA